MDFQKFLQLARALEQQQVDYVPVGGIALGVHGLVRATEDVDLFVRPEPDNIGRVRAALRAVWPDPEIDQILDSDFTGEYPAVRYGPPDGSFAVDLLARPGSRFGFDDLESQLVVVEGVTIRVATPRTLFRMKSGTARPIDRSDAASLREKFGLEGD